MREKEVRVVGCTNIERVVRVAAQVRVGADRRVTEGLRSSLVVTRVTHSVTLNPTSFQPAESSESPGLALVDYPLLIVFSRCFAHSLLRFAPSQDNFRKLKTSSNFATANRPLQAADPGVPAN